MDGLSVVRPVLIQRAVIGIRGTAQCSHLYQLFVTALNSVIWVKSTESIFLTRIYLNGRPGGY